MEVQTTWFDRHGSTPITELPTDWPEDYKRLVERRIELIETDRNIALIEQPEYKAARTPNRGGPSLSGRCEAGCSTAWKATLTSTAG